MIGLLATLPTIVVGSSVSAGGPAGSSASGHPATCLHFLRTRGSQAESRILRRGVTGETDWSAPKGSGCVVRVSISVVGVVPRRV